MLIWSYLLINFWLFYVLLMLNFTFLAVKLNFMKLAMNQRLCKEVGSHLPPLHHEDTWCPTEESSDTVMSSDVIIWNDWINLYRTHTWDYNTQMFCPPRSTVSLFVVCSSQNIVQLKIKLNQNKSVLILWFIQNFKGLENKSFRSVFWSHSVSTSLSDWLIKH